MTLFGSTTWFIWGQVRGLLSPGLRLGVKRCIFFFFLNSEALYACCKQNQKASCNITSDGSSPPSHCLKVSMVQLVSILSNMSLVVGFSFESIFFSTCLRYNWSTQYGTYLKYIIWSVLTYENTHEIFTTIKIVNVSNTLHIDHLPLCLSADPTPSLPYYWPISVIRN